MIKRLAENIGTYIYKIEELNDFTRADPLVTYFFLCWLSFTFSTITFFYLLTSSKRNRSITTTCGALFPFLPISPLAIYRWGWNNYFSGLFSLCKIIYTIKCQSETNYDDIEIYLHSICVVLHDCDFHLNVCWNKP